MLHSSLGKDVLGGTYPRPVVPLINQSDIRLARPLLAVKHTNMDKDEGYDQRVIPLPPGSKLSPYKISGDMICFSEKIQGDSYRYFCAREFAFDSGGKIIKGGVETYRIMSSIDDVECIICGCQVKLKHADTQYTPYSADPTRSSMASYLLMTNLTRTLCNNCSSVLQEGEPKNSRDVIVKGRVDLKELYGNVRYKRHAHARMQRTKLRITNRADEADMIQMTDTRYLPRDLQNLREEKVPKSYPRLYENPRSIRYDEGEEGEVMDEDDETGPHIDDACVHVSLYSFEGMSGEVYTPSHPSLLRRFNMTPFIKFGAVKIPSKDKYATYKITTILPTMYSREKRIEVGINKAQLILMNSGKGQIELKYDDMRLMAQNQVCILFVKKGGDNSSVINKALKILHLPITSEPVRLSDYLIMIGGSEYPVSSFSTPDLGFKLMTDYTSSKCYVCYRMWRGGTKSKCYGSICPYQGTMPNYNGLYASAAMLSFCEDKVKGGVGVELTKDAAEKISDEKPGNYDVIAVTSNSRCMVGGRTYSCGAQSGRSYPTSTLEYGGKRLGCCVNCLIRLEGDERYTFSERTTSIVRYFRLPILASIGEIMTVREVPTVFKKRAVFGIPDTNDINMKLSYLASATGHETEVLGPYIVNAPGDSADVPQSVLQNQGSMSIEREHRKSERYVPEIITIDGKHRTYNIGNIFGDSAARKKDQAKRTVSPGIKKQGYGEKMLAQMGWSVGKGLGKNEDGIVEPVQVVKRKGKLGLGADAAGVDGDLQGLIDMLPGGLAVNDDINTYVNGQLPRFIILDDKTFVPVTCDTVIDMIVRLVNRDVSEEVINEMIDQSYNFLRAWRCLLVESLRNPTLSAYCEGTVLRTGIQGLESESVLTKDKIYAQNYIGVNLKTDGTYDTPIFMQDHVVRISRQMNDSDGGIDFTQMGKMLIASKGPYKTFKIGGTTFPLRWKSDMWVSSLFSPRYYTVMATGVYENEQGMRINSAIVITPRYMSHYTLNVYGASTYGKTSPWGST